jgi:hypothetical protein
MSDLRPAGEKFKLCGKEYNIKFTLNTIDDIQDHFDITLAEVCKMLSDEKKQIKILKYILASMVNESIDEENEAKGSNIQHITERFIGHNLQIGDLTRALTGVFKTINAGSPNGENEVGDPNRTSE